MCGVTWCGVTGVTIACHSSAAWKASLIPAKRSSCSGSFEWTACRWVPTVPSTSCSFSFTSFALHGEYVGGGWVGGKYGLMHAGLAQIVLALHVAGCGQAHIDSMRQRTRDGPLMSNMRSGSDCSSEKDSLSPSLSFFFESRFADTGVRIPTVGSSAMMIGCSASCCPRYLATFSSFLRWRGNSNAWIAAVTNRAPSSEAVSVSRNSVSSPSSRSSSESHASSCCTTTRLPCESTPREGQPSPSCQASQ